MPETVALSGEGFEKYKNNFYFDPKELVSNPNFETFSKFFEISFFTYPNFFQTLQDCDRFLTDCPVFEKAMDCQYMQFNQSMETSNNSRFRREKFWSHLLALSLMFSNRNNIRNDKKNQDINFTDSFFAKKNELKMKNKALQRKMFHDKIKALDGQKRGFPPLWGVPH